MKKFYVAAAAAIAAITSSAANATPICDLLTPGTPEYIKAGCANAVPEISALEGTAALAALAAIMLIAWERKRKAG